MSPARLLALLVVVSLAVFISSTNATSYPPHLQCGAFYSAITKCCNHRMNLMQYFVTWCGMCCYGHMEKDTGLTASPFHTIDGVFACDLGHPVMAFAMQKDIYRYIRLMFGVGSFSDWRPIYSPEQNTWNFWSNMWDYKFSESATVSYDGSTAYSQVANLYDSSGNLSPLYGAPTSAGHTYATFKNLGNYWGNGVAAQVYSVANYLANGGSSVPAFGGNCVPTFGGTSVPLFGGNCVPSFGGLSIPFLGNCVPSFGGNCVPSFGGNSVPIFGGACIPNFGGSSVPNFGGGGGGNFGRRTEIAERHDTTKCKTWWSTRSPVATCFQTNLAGWTRGESYNFTNRLNAPTSGYGECCGWVSTTFPNPLLYTTPGTYPSTHQLDTCQDNEDWCHCCWLATAFPMFASFEYHAGPGYYVDLMDDFDLGNT